MFEHERRPPDDASDARSSFLRRVAQFDDPSWRRLMRIYSRSVVAWRRSQGLQEADAADVAQEVFQRVAKSLSSFERDGYGKRFRHWMRAIAVSRARSYRRRMERLGVGRGGEEFLRELAQLPDDSDPSTWSGPPPMDERLEILVRIKETVGPIQWAMFERRVIHGESAAVVAQAFGVTKNAVYLTQSRLLRRVRKELAAQRLRGN